jgi:hypothetical protein
MDPVHCRQVLKRDVFGRVERLERAGELRVLRVACGSRVPLSGLVARILLGRERRALERLDGLAGVPALERDPSWSVRGEQVAPRELLVRAWLPGEPLHLAESLPADFFEHLAALVRRMHARGVCHNDLHKEQNVVVAPDGTPGLIDFQLASVHARRGRSFAARVHDDLRHVDKHARRYLRPGRGPAGVAAPGGERPARTTVAALWRRTVKPLYQLVTRRMLRTRDGEARRPSSGPWPRWTPPLGRTAALDD